MIGALAIAGALLLPVADAVGSVAGPRCYGETNDGRVVGAKRMPISGANFETYCLPCVLALRTYGHAPAIDATVEAYDELARTAPSARFVYGEIGFPWGGRFRPHRTHRNGLSFDFMVPLVEGTLPTGIGNRFGYDEAFDADGVGQGGRVDFSALAAHLRALEVAAEARGGGIALVVLAPDLQDDLFAVDPGLRSAMRFNRNPSWVRHDDHYHVDFAFPCE